MKKILFPILAIALLAGAMSCQREHPGTAAGDKVNVTFQLGLEGLQTKAFSDGTTATSLDVYVYNVREQSTVYLEDLTLQEEEAFVDLTASVSMVLARGEHYQIVFWAHSPESPYTIDEENATLTVDPDGVANDENRDGFLGVYDAVITEPVSPNVQLKRPFAQINVLTTMEDWENSQVNGIEFTGSSMTVTAPTELNLLTGEVSKEAAQTFSMAPIDEDVTIPEFEEGAFVYVAMNYVLADVNASLVGDAGHPFTFEVYRDGQEDFLFQHSMVNVPIQRNYRTIIVGAVFCVDAAFEVEIVPDYEGNLDADDNTATIATITASNVSVEEGKTVAINATTNSSAAISYVSNDESIATVSTDGIVTGVKAGSTTITLSVPKVEGEFTAASKTITVTVTAAAVNPPVTTNITIDGTFTDWANVEAIAGTGAIKVMKVASNATQYFFYLEADLTELNTDTSHSFANYLTMCFDNGDEQGDHSVSYWKSAQYDLYMQLWLLQSGVPNLAIWSVDGFAHAEAVDGNTAKYEFCWNRSFNTVFSGNTLRLGAYLDAEFVDGSDWLGSLDVIGFAPASDQDMVVVGGSTTPDPGDEPGGDEPGGDEPGTGITLGDMSYWATGGTALASNNGGTGRIRSWKYAVDDSNLYFYFVLRKEKMRAAYGLSLVFDWAENSGSYSCDNLSGGELTIAIYPFTNESGGTPVCVNGTISSAWINISQDNRDSENVTNGLTIKAYGLDPDPAASGGDADYYLEMSIPRSNLPDLPEKGTTINLGAGYEWYNTGFQEVTI